MTALLLGTWNRDRTAQLRSVLTALLLGTWNRNRNRNRDCDHPHRE